MLHDLLSHLPTSVVVASLAQRIRQEHSASALALRDLEAITKRERDAGHLDDADRLEALAAELRGALPILAVADQLEREAQMLKRGTSS